MKRLLVAVAALLLSGCAPTIVTESATVPRVEITWAGIYTGTRTSTELGTDGIPLHELKNVVLIKSTTTIPAKQGVNFGVQYRVTGAPQSRVIELRRLVRYPAPGAANPSVKALLPYHEIEVQCAPGETCGTGYNLAQPWELIPGTWSFEFWSGDHKLAEQSFRVVRQ